MFNEPDQGMSHQQPRDAGQADGPEAKRPEPHLVVYDGDCIFCQNYVSFLRLRENVGPVELLDARSGDPRVERLWHEGYDLNEGMIFVHDGTVHYGPEAMRMLSELSGDPSLAGRARDQILSRGRIVNFAYPLLKLGRRLTLLARGKRLMRRPEAPAAKAGGPAGRTASES